MVTASGTGYGNSQSRVEGLLFSLWVLGIWAGSLNPCLSHRDWVGFVLGWRSVLFGGGDVLISLSFIQGGRWN